VSVIDSAGLALGLYSVAFLVVAGLGAAVALIPSKWLDKWARIISGRESNRVD
jgi:hypothetical protein